jgi:hypothetical protein
MNTTEIVSGGPSSLSKFLLHLRTRALLAYARTRVRCGLFSLETADAARAAALVGADGDELEAAFRVARGGTL